VSIKQTLNQDMKDALRAGNKLELSTLRMALAAIKKQEIEVRGELGDDAVLSLIGKLIKQGKDAGSQFESAGRSELAEKEAAEVAVLERYMPKALSPEETETLIQHAIGEAGASTIKDMGRVMGVIKSRAAGQVDMGAVSARVREILSVE
jgi:uncharacterized protein YqeY